MRYVLATKRNRAISTKLGVEVYAIGNTEQLDSLAGLLWKGPRWAEVPHVEQREEPVLKYRGFHIEP